MEQTSCLFNVMGKILSMYCIFQNKLFFSDLGAYLIGNKCFGFELNRQLNQVSTLFLSVVSVAISQMRNALKFMNDSDIP